MMLRHLLYEHLCLQGEILQSAITTQHSPESTIHEVLYTSVQYSQKIKLISRRKVAFHDTQFQNKRMDLKTYESIIVS